MINDLDGALMSVTVLTSLTALISLTVLMTHPLLGIA